MYDDNQDWTAADELEAQYAAVRQREEEQRSRVEEGFRHHKMATKEISLFQLRLSCYDTIYMIDGVRSILNDGRPIADLGTVLDDDLKGG